MEYGRRKSSWRRCSRHLACCGFLFLVLCQASGCGDNASPPAPTPIWMGTPTPPPVAANHSPVASAAVIPDQALPVGRNAATVDMAPYFTDLDGDTLTYTVVSSDAGVVIASVSGSTVTLTPVSAGATTVAVTAMDPGGATATQSIAVTVQESEPPPPSTPDLVVALPSVSDSNPVANAEFTFSATVRNVGDGDAAATTLRYYGDSTDTSGMETQQPRRCAITGPQTPHRVTGAVGGGTRNDRSRMARRMVVTGESDVTNNCSSSVRVDVTTRCPR